MIEGPAGEPSLPGGPGTVQDPELTEVETCAPARCASWSACRGRASDSGQGWKNGPGEDSHQTPLDQQVTPYL